MVHNDLLEYIRSDFLVIIRKHIGFYAIHLVICIFSFIVLISNDLTNTYDGLWNGSYYRGYHWVISTGRFVWPFIGFMRAHLSPEPFTSIFAFSIYVLAGCLIISIFRLWGKWQSFLIVPLLLVNTSVSSALAYRYISPTYAASFLFGVLAFWVLIRFQSNFGVVLSSLLIVGCLGCYQTSLGCFCILGIIYLLHLLLNKRGYSEILKQACRSLISFFAGCIIYKIIWDIGMKVLNVHENGYKGSDEISVISIIMMLPQRVKDAYREYWSYFFGTSELYNVFQNTYFFYAVCIVLVMVFLLIAFILMKGDVKRVVLFILLVILIPLGANIALIFAPSGGGIAIHMTHPLMMSVCGIFCLLFSEDLLESYFKRFGKALIFLCSFLCMIIVFGNFLQTSVDQEVMLSSRNATYLFMNRVVADIERRNEITDYSEQIVFVGKPSDNPGYRKGFQMYDEKTGSGSAKAEGSLWNIANAYARYGDFWSNGYSGIQSYIGVLRDCGMNYSVNRSENLWNNIMKRDDVVAMPVYPYDGYIAHIDGITVIKISN